MNWSMVKLGALCHKITDGSHNPPKGIGESEYLMLSSKNIFHDEIHFKNPRYLTQQDFVQENKRTDVCLNDVLLTIVGTVGRTAVVSNEHPKFVLQRSVAVLKPITDLIAPRFLMYSLQSLSNVLTSGARGVAQKGIYLKQIRDLKIPLPPLPEQQKIAAILDAADSLRQKDQQLIDHYTTLSQSLFLEMFGDPVTNPMGWEVSSFDELVSDNCPLTYGIVQPGDEFDDGVAVVRPVDLTTRYIGVSTLKKIDPSISDKFKRTRLKGGEILLSVRGSVGVASFALPELSGANVTRGIVPIWMNKNKMTDDFAFVLLQTDGVQRVIKGLAKGATLIQINLKDLREIKVICPPISLQNMFTQHVVSIEQQKQQAQASLEKSEALFNSLLQRAFKGELTGSKAA